MLFDIPVDNLSPGPSTPRRGTKNKAEGNSSLPDEVSYDALQEYLKSDVGSGTLRGEWPHKQSVSSAYWDPQGKNIVSTCYDNNLRRELIFMPSIPPSPCCTDLPSPSVWDVSQSLRSKGPLHSFNPFCQVKHDCQTVSILITFCCVFSLIHCVRAAG